MRPRYPIELPKNRRLRVCFYARFSTDEQNPLSISDQYASCERYLKDAGVTEYDAERFADEGVSGEILSRPGIDEVRRGIEQRRWDLLIAEESSRLFRSPSGSLVFFEAAVDRDMRIICFNDFVDTADEDWEEMLIDAQQHHKKSNKFTRRRVERSFLGRWESNAAVTWLKPGHARKAQCPATEFEEERGPYYDHIDPATAPIVREAFERMAAKDEPWLVVKFLQESGLSRRPEVPGCEWNERGLYGMIRTSVYRGEESHGNTKTIRKFRGAKPEQIRNDPERIRTRPMPHLRVVSDAIWLRANAWIDERMRKKNSPRGDSHPLKGIPRLSRKPLSQIFVCGRCGEVMWAEGRNEGGYRCSSARKRGCWNRATSLSELSHARIGTAIADQLLKDRAVLETMIETVRAIALDDDVAAKRVEQLQEKIESLERRKERIEEAIDKSKFDVTTLVERLNEVNNNLLEARSDWETANQSTLEKSCPATREDVILAIDQATRSLLTAEREVNPLLKRMLVGPIRAVPFVQALTNKVVLRARFTIRLANLLPSQLTGQLPAEELRKLEFCDRQFEVDLFEQPEYHRRYQEFIAAKAANPTARLPQLANVLGISHNVMRNVSAFARRLRKAGVTELYTELTERPAKASRWKQPV
jgi:site-specific DNA recombinase